MKQFLSALFLCLLCGVCFGQDQTVEVNKIVMDDFVAGASPDVSNHAFTFAMRVKLLGKGESKGNGDGNGMLFSVASGWHDGIRAYYSWGNNSIVFQIGRVETKSAATVSSRKSVAPGALHDIVCAWDGKTMFLYIDGELSSQLDYSGSVTTHNAPLKVGNGGYGIGSNKMFVDKLDYYSRAITPQEVADRFAKHPADEKAKLALLDACRLIPGVANCDMSDQAYETFLAFSELPTEASQAARNSFWQKLIAEEKYEQAAKLVLAEAADLLKLEVPVEEKTADQTQRISRILALARALFNLERKLPDQNPAFSKAQADLKAKFPDEYALLEKISTLKKSAQRLEQLEISAIGQFNATQQRLASALQADAANRIYVAPTGSDDKPGTKDAPVASLTKAFELASAQAVDEAKTTVIELADGTYYCSQTAILTGAKNVLVVPADGAKVVLTGAKPLCDFQPIADSSVAKRFQESVRAKILVCDLKAAGIDDLGKLGNRGYGVGNIVAPIPDLFVNGEAQTLARWPNESESPLQFGEVILGSNAVLEGRGRRTDSQTFRYDFDRPDHWLLSDNPEENDIWANGLFRHEWASNTRKVKNIDRKAKTITVDYNDVSGRFHYYFLNIPEELDQPGEYYIDRTSGKLFFLPPPEILNAEGKIIAQVELSVSEKRLVDLEKCQNVVLKNLTFKGGRESGLQMAQCFNCYLTDSTIEQFGGNGAIIDGGAFCGLFNSQIREMGACGTRLFGGDRATLTPCGHTVHNCRISDFSRIDRSYAPAFQTGGCGIVMTNNLVYDSPHHAFRTDGNDMYVARNEVHSVVYEYSDQSGIDVYCDPTFRGIVIEQNFWHHIGSSLALCGQAGIRLDDSISGVIMNKNVFYRSSGGMFGGIQIHGGHDNLCFGNLFVNCKQAFSFSPWDNQRFQDFLEKAFPKYLENPLYLKTYPFMDEIREHVNRNYIIRNEAINCQEFQRNGLVWDIFCNNLWKTVDSAPSKDDSIPSPQQLRRWIEQVSGRSLENIGLVGGQDQISHPVTPHYTEK